MREEIKVVKYILQNLDDENEEKQFEDEEEITRMGIYEMERADTAGSQVLSHGSRNLSIAPLSMPHPKSRQIQRLGQEGLKIPF